jgi:hypothetical protein
MSDAAIVLLGAARVTDKGVPLVQAVQPVTNDQDDIEPLGDAEVFQCLGVTSIPWPKTKEGYAEGLAILNVGGRDVVLVGARDLRTAKIVGKMKPGDTVVHSTGPEQAAQLQLKEKSRQAVLATKDSKKETMLFILDGTEDEAMVIAAGNVFKMSRKDGVIISDASGKGGIQIKDGTVRILGTLMLPGSAPNPAFKLMMGPATGSPGGPASVPLFAVPGVVCGN